MEHRDVRQRHGHHGRDRRSARRQRGHRRHRRRGLDLQRRRRRGESGAGRLGRADAERRDRRRQVRLERLDLRRRQHRARRARPQDNGNKGAAWTFVFVAGDGWVQGSHDPCERRELPAACFGWGVALSGDTTASPRSGSTVIGGPADVGPTSAGAIWRFRPTRTAGSRRTPSSAVGLGRRGVFGYGVALSSDANTALVGGFDATTAATARCGVFVAGAGMGAESRDGLDDVSARRVGYIDPNGIDTNYHVEYGTTDRLRADDADRTAGDRHGPRRRRRRRSTRSSPARPTTTGRRDERRGDGVEPRPDVLDRAAGERRRRRSGLDRRVATAASAAARRRTRHDRLGRRHAARHESGSVTNCHLVPPDSAALHDRRHAHVRRRRATTRSQATVPSGRAARDAAAR